MKGHLDLRKRGQEPVVHVAQDLTPELEAIYAAWPDRFRTKVDIGTGCWTWNACKDAAGYGRYGDRTRSSGVEAAHRYAWALVNGPIPEKHDVDHLCRNPSCVRPDHLEPVTRGDNLRRGLPANVAGVCRAGTHAWIPENILTEPSGTNRCKPCRQAKEAERTARRREARRGAAV